MISKEDKKILESYVRDFDERNKYCVAFREDLLKLAIENILEYIQQLETKHQKVIDKLKNNIKNNNFRETECLEDKGRYYYSKEILEIMKGEE